MKLTRSGAALALAFAAGCSDGPSGPPPFAAVSIEYAAIPLEERTIRVGESLQLEAGLRDAAGNPASGPAITWRSTAPEVASVSATGLVTARADGTALVIASAGSLADTARINVASPIGGEIVCSSGDPRVRLAVGEVYTTTADRATHLCVEGDADGEYALIPFNASRVSASGAMLRANFRAAGTVPTTTALTSAATSRRGAAPAMAPSDFHRRLRQRAAPGLEARMRAVQAAPQYSRSLAAAAVPAVGEVMRLNVETLSSDGCSNPDYRGGRVVAVTRRAVVVADTLNPEGFSDDEYRALGERFDDLVYPLDTEFFGTPTDLDRNERVILFFTRAVNDLTSAGSGFYVAGFFYDRDLFPTSGSTACPGSNYAEMVYMMVPDPQRAAAGQMVFTKQHVARHTVGVLAHEFQHLVNASRRLHVNQAPVWEEEWLNEGLSHVAEELLFYHVSGLSAGGNHSPATISTLAAREAFQAYQLQNHDRFADFLESPSSSSPIAGNDALATRGASWAFLRYAADRRGGDPRQLWRSLVDSKTAGLANLGAALGADPVDWLNDWTVSLYLDDTSLAPAPRYQQPSWNHRAVLSGLVSLGGSQGYTRYPLELRCLWESDCRTFSDPLNLRAGSAAFFRFGVPAGQTAVLRTTSGDLPAPSTLRLTLVRTR